MTEKVVRFCDYERRSREPDGAVPRDPCDADVIAFPRRSRNDPDFLELQFMMLLGIAAAFAIPVQLLRSAQ